jgi:hypothetical protein
MQGARTLIGFDTLKPAAQKRSRCFNRPARLSFPLHITYQNLAASSRRPSDFSACTCGSLHRPPRPSRAPARRRSRRRAAGGAGAGRTYYQPPCNRYHQTVTSIWALCIPRTVYGIHRRFWIYTFTVRIGSSKRSVTRRAVLIDHLTSTG